jgi:hypothetical protein
MRSNDTGAAFNAISFILFVAFTPFVRYVPVTASEYQPFFLIMVILFLMLGMSSWTGKEDGVILNGAYIIGLLPLLCVLSILEIFFSDSKDAAQTSYRFANLMVGLIFFSRRDVVQQLARPSRILWFVLFLYSVVALLQILGVLPANLPITNRSEANAIDLLDSGRGVPSLATEPSTFGDVLAALLISHWLASHLVGKRVNNIFVLLAAAALIVLSRSTVYFVIASAALILLIPKALVRKPMSTIVLMLMFPIALATILPVLQPRSAELFLNVMDSGVSLDALLEAFASAGPQSFSFRATNLFGVPWFVYEDFFSSVKSVCNTFIFLESRCVVDASSLAGMYLTAPIFGVILASTCYFYLLLCWVRGSRGASLSIAFFYAFALLATMHVSGNSPFFPLYVALLAMPMAYRQSENEHDVSPIED